MIGTNQSNATVGKTIESRHVDKIGESSEIYSPHHTTQREQRRDVTKGFQHPPKIVRSMPEHQDIPDTEVPCTYDPDPRPSKPRR